MPCVQLLGAEEAFAVGSLTLVNCANGFDPLKGFAFTTYAYRSIHTDIIRAAKKNAKLSRSLPRCSVDGEEHVMDIPAPMESVDLDADEEVLPGLLDRLPERWRTVVAMRFGLDGEQPQTLQQIGEALGVHRERARQLVEQSLKLMRD
jgi:RNA polymerase sigma factor (sigma-70 family)